MGTGFRKWSFSRPRRLATTRPASSSSFKCFMTPKRDILKRASSALSVCPSSRKSSSSKLLRVGSARALNTLSMPKTIGDHMVTCQELPDHERPLESANSVERKGQEVRAGIDVEKDRPQLRD